MSRTQLATLLILGFALLPATTSAQEAAGVLVHEGFLDGNDYQNRTDREKHAYLMGFTDGLMAAPLFSFERMGDTMTLTWFERCEAKGNSGQLQAIIDRYLDQHPENWHDSMSGIFFLAMKDVCDFELVPGRNDHR